MRAATDWLRGTARLRISGAFPEGCLNRFSAAGLSFWNPARPDAFTIDVTIYDRDADRACDLARRAMCEAEILRRRGFARSFYGLRRRGALLLGLCAVVIAAYVLPQFIWTLEVVGNETVPEAEILQALEQIGVGFGTWGPSVDSQTVKNKMLNLVPELSWIAVNRHGGRATIEVAERTPVPELSDRMTPANLVAARTGIVEELLIYDGTAVVEPGQTVLRGQLLVSGTADYILNTSLTHSMGEVYARTWHRVDAVTPSEVAQKDYTGHTVERYSLILGKNRCNFFRNSSNFGGSCDKIIENYTLTLPGGIPLPVRLQKQTLLPYTTRTVSLEEAEAEQRLTRFAEAAVSDRLAGGELLKSDLACAKDGGCWRLTGTVECREQIAAEAPIYTTER